MSLDSTFSIALTPQGAPATEADEQRLDALRDGLSDLFNEGLAQWLSLIDKEPDPATNPLPKWQRTPPIEDQTIDQLADELRGAAKTLSSSLKDLGRSEDPEAQSIASDMHSAVGDVEHVTAALDTRANEISEQITGAVRLAEATLSTTWPVMTPEVQLEALEQMLAHAPSEETVGYMLARMTGPARALCMPEIWERALGRLLPHPHRMSDRLRDLATSGWGSTPTGPTAWLRRHLQPDVLAWVPLFHQSPRSPDHLAKLGVPRAQIAQQWRAARPELGPNTWHKIPTYLDSALQLGPEIQVETDVLPLLMTAQDPNRAPISPTSLDEGRLMILRKLFTTPHTWSGEQVAKYLVAVKPVTVPRNWQALWQGIGDWAGRHASPSSWTRTAPDLATAIRPLLSDEDQGVREVAIRLIGLQRTKATQSSRAESPSRSR